MTSSWRKGAWAPVLIGVVAAALTACITWLLVRSDVARWSEAGFTVGPEMKFVVFFSGAAGVTGFFLARRLLRGPFLTRKEWTLIVPQAQRAEHPRPGLTT
jgi:Mg/Co/Ni transporter MgtE